MDDNEELLDLIKSRLELGKTRYGHGVVVDQDTTEFGTEENDWQLMALEEMLDGLTYDKLIEAQATEAENLQRLLKTVPIPFGKTIMIG